MTPFRGEYGPKPAQGPGLATGSLLPVEARLEAVWPPGDWQDLTVLVAVSGGADSVALLRALAALGRRTPTTAGRLVVGHFNHRLRGSASDADETWVARLSEGLGLACEIGRPSPGEPLPAGGDGIEAAARHARYQFLRQAAERLGARYVVTAHTADDQAETILHRILRGTGIAGLAGMARARPLGPVATLLRPLLGFRRADLLAYLDGLGQAYCRDATNDDPRFTRNRIRHGLLPQLAEQFNPAVTDAILRLGTLAGEAQAVIHKLAAERLQRAAAREPGGVRIDAAVLGRQPRFLVREVLVAAWRQCGWPAQAMGFEEWDLLADLVLGAAAFVAGQDPSAPQDIAGEEGKRPPRPHPARKHVLPGGVVAESRGGQLWLTRPDQPWPAVSPPS